MSNKMIRSAEAIRLHCVQQCRVYLRYLNAIGFIWPIHLIFQQQCSFVFFLFLFLFCWPSLSVTLPVDEIWSMLTCLKHTPNYSESEWVKSYNVMNPNKYIQHTEFRKFHCILHSRTCGNWRSEKQQSNGLRLMVGIVLVCILNGQKNERRAEVNFLSRWDIYFMICVLYMLLVCCCWNCMKMMRVVGCCVSIQHTINQRTDSTYYFN